MIAALLGKYCSLGYECEDVFHMKCYENKCVCRANNVVVNFQCKSLLDGYCWSNEYCLPFNSECRDQQCVCKKNYNEILNDRCIPSKFLVLMKHCYFLLSLFLINTFKRF